MVQLIPRDALREDRPGDRDELGRDVLDLGETK
jgi:hypothetical protein